MTTHRSAWLLGWGSASLLGVCLALLLWPVGGVVLLFLVAAVTSVLVSVTGYETIDSTAPDAVRTWLGHAAVRAAVSGAVAVACLAVASVAPLALVALLLLAWATSPSSVGRVRAHLAERQRTRSATCPEQAQIWSAVATSAAQALTDHDLCRAWCTSFDALQSASDVEARARIVSLRQAYLDELDRRNPLGLRAWLDSGARATGNPDRYLSRPGGDWPRND